MGIIKMRPRIYAFVTQATMDWLTENDDAILGNAIADIKMLMQSIKNPSKNTVAILYR